MNKPRVRYIDAAGVKIGQSASVYTEEHMRLRGWLRTTSVLNIKESGDGPIFETRNTIYEPHSDEQLLGFSEPKEAAHDAVI